MWTSWPSACSLYIMFPVTGLQWFCGTWYCVRWWICLEKIWICWIYERTIQYNAIHPVDVWYLSSWVDISHNCYRLDSFSIRCLVTDAPGSTGYISSGKSRPNVNPVLSQENCLYYLFILFKSWINEQSHNSNTYRSATLYNAAAQMHCIAKMIFLLCPYPVSTTILHLHAAVSVFGQGSLALSVNPHGALERLIQASLLILARTILLCYSEHQPKAHIQ